MFVNFLKVNKTEFHDPKLHETFTNIIEGAKAFDQLFPVSKLTGLRENPYALLQSLEADPQKSRALSELFMELEPINMAKVSVDDMLASLKSRLDSGTFFDDDVYRERLSSLYDSIEAQFEDEVNVSKQKSNPKPSDGVSFDGEGNSTPQV